MPFRLCKSRLAESSNAWQGGLDLWDRVHRRCLWLLRRQRKSQQYRRDFSRAGKQTEGPPVPAAHLLFAIPEPGARLPVKPLVQLALFIIARLGQKVPKKSHLLQEAAVDS